MKVPLLSSDALKGYLTEEIIGRREFLALARNFMYSWNKLLLKQNNLQD